MTQYLLSVPAAMARCFKSKDGLFASSDPEGTKLGSAGGTAQLLYEAYKASPEKLTFREWLQSSRKLIVHGGGQSRRLPAYAAVGKPFIPMPVIRQSHGQSFRQNLLDFQLPDYDHIFNLAPASARVMVTSGDVLLKFGENIPALPEADILAMGMAVSPEQSESFGVFFTPDQSSSEVSFFLQKPKADVIRALATDHSFLVDTGMWLFSEAGIMALMEKCGWDDSGNCFRDGVSNPYELYHQFGLFLGSNPTENDSTVSNLQSAVISLPSPQFYHMGTSRQLIESLTVLQNIGSNAMWTGLRHPDQFIQNSTFDMPTRRPSNHTLWVENSHIPSTWHIEHEHTLTGVPVNDWNLKLDAGVCLDFSPILGYQDKLVVRTYGIDDPFRGPISDKQTQYLGASVGKWFADRNIEIESAGIDADCDIQFAPIFPLIDPDEVSSDFIRWLFSSDVDDSERHKQLYLSLPRFSAEDIRTKCDIAALGQTRSANRSVALLGLYSKREKSVFYRLDLADTAKVFSDLDVDIPDDLDDSGLSAAEKTHDHMFRAVVLRQRNCSEWHEEESKAFAQLRQAIISESNLDLAQPVCSILRDQIVWGRSPVRIDISGGWTDTPPHCLEHGGKVVNIAVNLNGQPPVQVFAKLSERPELTVRSIDLGVEQVVHTYEELDTYALPGSEFALAKAALALAGFLPRFHSHGGYDSLKQQFEAFGGGIEVSLLAAMPAGSGLGTSSILGATLLGTISDLCGLGWDKHELVGRTLAVEQMLTTGGGWQDQVGGIFGGLKISESAPGLVQRPMVRWLPDKLFGPGYANETVLLYYTGITRLAKNILQEIVRGMFLNEPKRLRILNEMRSHALATFEAFSRNDYQALGDAVAKSWVLNQSLDAGTNPPAVQEILDMVSDDILGAKLPGAGGGGYMLMLAKDKAAGDRIRHRLTQNPPNARSRFVDLSVSQGGLEITRS